MHRSEAPTVQRQSNESYGKTTLALANRQNGALRKKIAFTFQIMGGRISTSDSWHNPAIVPNRFDRNLFAAAPNHIWLLTSTALQAKMTG